MHESLRHLDHRPWPLPTTAWAWRQSWLELAFIHFPVGEQLIRNLVPPGLRVQTFGGSAWVGLVPFQMAGVTRRGLTDVPGFSNFPELNLRTYVERDGKPGVWFFSLDAASLPVVLGGRRLYGLPYFHARMSLRIGQGGWRHFNSQRRGSQVRFDASYRPIGPRCVPDPGSFEHWATERYCLYAGTSGRLSCMDVHHAPWPLQPAEVQIRENGILMEAGIEFSETDPVCHFSTGVHVISFPPQVVVSGSSEQRSPAGRVSASTDGLE